MIGTLSFKQYSDILGEAQIAGIEALSPLICMYNTLQETNISQGERFTKVFKNQIDATYSYIVQKHADIDIDMRRCVTSLNNHILKLYGSEYNYQNLDEFLEDQYLEANPVYASMSRFLGYPVTLEGEKSAFWKDVDDNWEDVVLNWDKIGWSNF